MLFRSDVYKTIKNIDIYFYENNLRIGFIKTVTVFIGLVAPILLVAFVSALMINYFQVGFLFTTKPLKIQLNRINPIEGFKRMFSKRALMELLKSILKILLIGYTAYSFIKKNILQIMELSRLEPTIILKNFASIAFSFVIRIIVVLIGLALIDYFFQIGRASCRERV